MGRPDNKMTKIINCGREYKEKKHSLMIKKIREILLEEIPEDIQRE